VVGMVLVRVEPNEMVVGRVLFGSPRRRQVKEIIKETVMESDDIVEGKVEEVSSVPQTRDSAIETNRVLFVDKSHQTTLEKDHTTSITSTSREIGTSPLKNIGTSPPKEFVSNPLKEVGTSPLKDVGTSPLKDVGTSPLKDVGASPLCDVYYSNLVSFLESPTLPRLDKSPVRGRSASPVFRGGKVPDLISWSPEPRIVESEIEEVFKRTSPPRRASPKIAEKRVEKRDKSPVRNKSPPRREESQMEELFDVRWLEKKRVNQARIWKDGRVFDQKIQSPPKKVEKVGGVKTGIDYKTTREDLDRLMRIYKTDL
jgi:hypothetical protein